MYCLLGLSVISLASIGFANWVIINSDSKTSAITAEIGQIENGNLTATILDTSDFTVRFDSISDSTGAITSGSDDETEKLYFNANFTLDIGNLSDFSGIQIRLGFNNSEGCGAKNFIDFLGTPGYIDTTLLSDEYTFKLGNETISETKLNAYLTYQYQIDNKVATVKVTYTFKWGSAFGEENPVLEKGDNPTESLKAFNSAFKEFKKTITDDENTNVVLTITPEMA